MHLRRTCSEPQAPAIPVTDCLRGVRLRGLGCGYAVTAPARVSWRCAGCVRAWQRVGLGGCPALICRRGGGGHERVRMCWPGSNSACAAARQGTLLWRRERARASSLLASSRCARLLLCWSTSTLVEHKRSLSPGNHMGMLGKGGRPSTHPLCQMPSTHPLCQRPSTHCLCQRPSTHPLCQRPSTHCLCQRPSTHPLCQMPSRGRDTRRSCAPPGRRRPSHP